MFLTMNIYNSILGSCYDTGIFLIDFIDKFVKLTEELLELSLF